MIRIVVIIIIILISILEGSCIDLINNNDKLNTLNSNQKDSLLAVLESFRLNNDTTGLEINTRRIYQSDSTNVYVLCKLALVQKRCKQFNRAIFYINRASVIDKNNSEVSYSKALVYSGKLSPDSILAFYNSAINFNSDSLKYYFGRAELLYEMKKYQLSLNDLDFIISKNFKVTDAHFYKTCIYYETDNWVKTKEISTITIGLIERSNNPYYYKLDEVYYARAFANLKLGDFANALSDSEMAIKFEPTKARFYKVRGFAKNKLGKKDESFEDFKIAAELGDPEAIEIYKKYLEHKATHKLI